MDSASFILIEEEKKEFKEMTNYDWDEYEERYDVSHQVFIGNPSVWLWLLSRDFWIFGEYNKEYDWFEKGLIIDEATIEKK